GDARQPGVVLGGHGREATPLDRHGPADRVPFVNPRVPAVLPRTRGAGMGVGAHGDSSLTLRGPPRPGPPAGARHPVTLSRFLVSRNVADDVLCLSDHCG